MDCRESMMFGGIYIITIKLNRKFIASLSIALLAAFVAMVPVCIKNAAAIFSGIILSDTTIVLDPGHGGIDGGAHDRMGLLEKDINLDVSLKIKEKLEGKNARVIMTRSKDTSLENKSGLRASRYRRDLDARKNIINKNRAGIFISIHVNTDPGHSETRGIILFHRPDSQQGKLLAQKIALSIDELVYKNLPEHRSLRTKIRTGDYYILRETRVTGVLVELGFLSNPQDKKLLQDEDFKQRIAAAISEGIDLYFNSL